MLSYFLVLVGEFWAIEAWDVAGERLVEVVARGYGNGVRETTFLGVAMCSELGLEPLLSADSETVHGCPLRFDPTMECAGWLV